MQSAFTNAGFTGWLFLKHSQHGWFTLELLHIHQQIIKIGMRCFIIRTVSF